MKRLNIPYIEALDQIGIEDAGALLLEEGAQARIDSINWPDLYNYMPLTSFGIARSSDAFFIHYAVKGSMLKAVYSKDLSPVHEDSCVEFFCQIPDSDLYCNFEFNAIGTCSASRRRGKKLDVVRLSPEELLQIERYPSLGRRPFKEMEGFFEWELTLKIPMELMRINPDNLPEKIRANFYKCADDTSSKHYVSWSPILTEKPDFHRPEFFGELIIKS